MAEERVAKSRTKKSESLCMIIKKNGKWHLKYFQGLGFVTVLTGVDF